jgi:hypothetical protein
LLQIAIEPDGPNALYRALVLSPSARQFNLGNEPTLIEAPDRRDRVDGILQ